MTIELTAFQQNGCCHFKGISVTLLALLPNLRHLSLTDDLDLMDPQHLHILQFLPHLQSLSLRLAKPVAWSQEVLGPLSSLNALTALSLSSPATDESWLVSPVLGQLTQLRHLKLPYIARYITPDSQDHWLEIVCKLTGLTSLDLHGYMENLPANIPGLTGLAHLELTHGCYKIGISEGPQPSIAQLVRSFSNLRCLFLNYLPISTTVFWQDVCKSLLLLSQLENLKIEYADLQDVSPTAWALPSKLTAVELVSCCIDTINPAISTLPLLRRLCIISEEPPGMSLSGFPSGPYLHNLQRLDIMGPSSETGSEALLQATHLRHLMVQFFGEYSPYWTRKALRKVVPVGCSIELYDDAACNVWWDDMPPSDDDVRERGFL